VPDTFDARFSARQRHYLYRIVNRRSDLTLERARAWRVPRRLDDVAMATAARHLLGRHDFTTFRHVDCQAKSPVKTLDQLDVVRAGDEVRIIARARSFLHTQVRSMVGALVYVGDGRWTENDLVSARDARDRSAGAVVAPPVGLYLVQVDY
jgi:tRNA pseudouridine38-40 synthase